MVAVVVVALAGCQANTPPNTAARVSHWLETLHDPDARQRKEAAFKLGNLGLTDPATIVPALTNQLKDTDAIVRCEVILALVKCGTNARETMEELTKVQRNDRDPRVRDYASKALTKLHGGS